MARLTTKDDLSVVCVVHLCRNELTTCLFVSLLLSRCLWCYTLLGERPLIRKLWFVFLLKIKERKNRPKPQTWRTKGMDMNGVQCMSTASSCPFMYFEKWNTMRSSRKKEDDEELWRSKAKVRVLKQIQNEALFRINEYSHTHKRTQCVLILNSEWVLSRQWTPFNVAIFAYEFLH